MSVYKESYFNNTGLCAFSNLTMVNILEIKKIGNLTNETQNPIKW